MYNNQFFRFVLFFFLIFIPSTCCLSQFVPNSNPKHIVFSDIKSYSFKVSFSKLKDATSYLVLVSEKSRPLAAPQQSVGYMRGDLIYDAKVAYVGSDTSFIPSAIRTNHVYHYLVFAFNGQDGTEKYQLSNPAYNFISTSDLNVGNYYEEVNSSSTNFAHQLHNLISSHKVISYFDYKTTMLEKVEIKDTLKGMRYVECVYSGDKKLFSGNFDWTKLGFSREHTFPHSWMPTYPANSPERPEYSDLHNLYPTNLDKANTVRNNYPFGEINGKVLYEFKEGRLGEMNDVIVYEPSNSQKGNVARSIFYMLTAYNSIENQWVLPLKQSEEILKKWHFQDLPDDYEKTRQEYIFDIQGNRNPFIDSVDFVCKIDFYKMIKSNKCTASLNEIEVNDLFSIRIDYEKNNFFILSDQDIQLELVSLNGTTIQIIPLNTRLPLFNSGIYFLRGNIKNQYCLKKIVF